MPCISQLLKQLTKETQNILKGEVYVDGSSLMMVGPKIITISVSGQKCFMVAFKKMAMKSPNTHKRAPKCYFYSLLIQVQARPIASYRVIFNVY